MQSDLRAVLEQLADETNDQPIELINSRGEKAVFSQMALIPVATPSEEFEDEVIEHNFALLQPLDENGEEVGDRLVFDFVKDAAGEVTVNLIDDPYIMRSVMELYIQRGQQFMDAEEEQSAEECESIFGGTLTEEVQESEEADQSYAEEKEQALKELVSSDKSAEGKKKGFFGKLFGKK